MVKQVWSKRLSRVFLFFLGILISQQSVAAPSPLDIVEYPASFVSRQQGAMYADRLPATRGYLFVPENRADPKSRLIMINFWRFKSTASKPAAPLFELFGGPGHAHIDVWETADSFAALRAKMAVSDVILFDQRGAASPSDNLPSLHCPNSFETGMLVPWRSRAEVNEKLASFVKLCAAYFERAGIDLRGYNNRESAHDIDDLRKSLGYDKINIAGESYGSYLARAYVELFPLSIHRAVIGGVISESYYDSTNNIPATLAVIGAGFTTDTGKVIPADPAFLANLAAVGAKLEKSPVTVAVKRPDTGKVEDITLGRYDLQFIVSYYTRDGTDEWLAMREASKAMVSGDFSWLAERAVLWHLGKHRSYFEGKLMGYLMACNAYRGAIPSQNWSPDPVVGKEAGMGPLPEICEELGPWLAPDRLRWTKSKVPTLIFNGEMDATTPLANAMELSKTFENAMLMIFKGSSHSVSDEAWAIADKRVNLFLAGAPFKRGSIEMIEVP